MSSFTISHGTRSALSSQQPVTSPEYTNVGDIKMSCISQDHENWLKCDGRSLSRTDF